ncbi:MAG TPA: aldehyde dehydrogenase family protein, partial [Pseudonocardia sp.]|nr:aldehyde dehydrogenase family protein [Pseudonocardia sp.]
MDALFVGGAWATARAGRRISVVSPSTEEEIGTVAEAGAAEADAAVAAARAAFEDPTGWANWLPAERAAALERLAAGLYRRGARIANLVSTQTGLPIAQSSSQEAELPAQLLCHYADMLRRSAFEQRRPRSAERTTLVRREPVGVVAAITPSRLPQTSAAMRYAPALAAGCTLVLKPSARAVLDTVPLAEAALEAGLPPGVFNVLPGGAGLGGYLVGHPGVDAVTFAGSASVGRGIASTCGQLLRPVTLELGVSSTVLVLDDADLTAIGEPLLGALLRHGGLGGLGSRVLAPKSRYAEVVELLVGLVRSLRVGEPLDERTQLGPLTSAEQREEVERHIAVGVAEGARLVAGGGHPPGRSRGWFLEPTVLADADNHQVIARQQVRGPVLAVIPYSDDADALRIANDSKHGLAGSVWTSDADRGLRLARQVRTGTIGV